MRYTIKLAVYDPMMNEWEYKYTFSGVKKETIPSAVRNLLVVWVQTEISPGIHKLFIEAEV